MALVIEAPNEIFNIENSKNIKLFLAGGITNCSDWQSEMIEKLKFMPKLSIYNPRRKNYPIDDVKVNEEQITWEYVHLQNADIILFWFAKGSLNPTVLYELGMWGNSRPGRPIIVGIDPGYERKKDVEIQTLLANKQDFKFTSSLDDIAESIKGFVTNVQKT